MLGSRSTRTPARRNSIAGIGVVFLALLGIILSATPGHASYYETYRVDVEALDVTVSGLVGGGCGVGGVGVGASYLTVVNRGETARTIELQVNGQSVDTRHLEASAASPTRIERDYTATGHPWALDIVVRDDSDSVVAWHRQIDCYSTNSFDRASSSHGPAYCTPTGAAAVVGITVDPEHFMQAGGVPVLLTVVETRADIYGTTDQAGRFSSAVPISETGTTTVTVRWDSGNGWIAAFDPDRDPWDEGGAVPVYTFPAECSSPPPPPPPPPAKTCVIESRTGSITLQYGTKTRTFSVPERVRIPKVCVTAEQAKEWAARYGWSL